MSTPYFSILHPTARVTTSGWKAARSAWLDLAAHPEQVEYILAVHYSDYVQSLPGPLVLTGDPRTAIHGYNDAAADSTGRILITGADDFFPPPEWDLRLLDVIYQPWVPAEFVIHVSTGSTRDANLISHPILSRALYNQWGYFFWPEYESVYADDDLTEHAQLGGLVIDARGLQFDHRHPALGKGVDDDVYRLRNRPEAYTQGKQVLVRRRLEGFDAQPHSQHGAWEMRPE